MKASNTGAVEPIAASGSVTCKWRKMGWRSPDIASNRDRRIAMLGPKVLYK
jgi:hypothetical protein